MDTFSFEFKELQQKLSKKLELANFMVDSLQQEQLLHFLFLLNKWNHVYNLTGITDLQEMIPQHILDSLAVVPYLHDQRILDVGSGGGLPGIPLAIVQPKRRFTLIDSNGKKTRFLHHVVQSLGLTNVQVVQERVEKFTATECFTSIIARAFSSIIDFLQKARHLCCANGYFLAMKGAYPAGELIALHGEFTLTAVHTLQTPGLPAERHLVCIKKGNSD